MITYQQICKKIIPLFHKQIQTETDYEIYLYALESFLSTLVNFLVLFSISLFLHITDYIIVYLLFFIPFRRYEGGLHAKTHFRCLALFLILLTMSILSSMFLCNRNLEIHIGILSLAVRNCLTLYRIIRPHHRNYKTKMKRELFCILTLITTLCYVIIYSFSSLHATIGAFALLSHTITSLNFFTTKTKA